MKNETVRMYQFQCSLDTWCNTTVMSGMYIGDHNLQPNKKNHGHLGQKYMQMKVIETEAKF